MKQRYKNLLLILLGALLLGFLWRVRGTHGWGSSWGLLNAGFLFSLFLTAAVGKREGPGLPLTVVGALAFMLTVPAWGTFLGQITGLLTVTAGDATAVYEISPVSGVTVMLLLGFGLASLYGILLGRSFGTKAWRVRDYAVLLAVFLLVGLAAKATVSHLILRLIEPAAVTAFRNGLNDAGIADGAYRAYMTHFSDAAWAKRIVGGRNYFSSVGTISLALSAAASLLTTRFAIKDRYAARTGAVVCGAFAVSITLSDLFFFFSNGGFRASQGFSLPDCFSAWSLWEYFTGFTAGGLITAYLLKTAPRDKADEAILRAVPEKPRRILCFLLCWIGGVGINTVRPLLLRLDETPYSVPAAICAGALLLLFALLSVKKTGRDICQFRQDLLAPALLLFFTVWIFILYMLVGDAQIRRLNEAHTILVTVSAGAIAAYCIGSLCSGRLRKQNRDS